MPDTRPQYVNRNQDNFSRCSYLKCIIFVTIRKRVFRSTSMKRIFLLILYILLSGPVFADPSDSTYLKDPFFIKLLKTNSSVPVFYNEQVKKQIGVYMRNLNNTTAMLIGKAQYYNQSYGKYFEASGVPPQLFLAAIAYSSFEPSYTDADGGSGLWALSYAIAKKYLLTTNSYVDERRNPEKSCVAAAKYFKDLNLIYQDWLKSLVAFRTGPINMNMAIHKAGNTLDYARIHNQLSPEFQNIAANYMAFWYIWNYFGEHRIIPVKYRIPDTDTVHVQKEIGFSAIAYNLNVSTDLIRLCNSELRLDIVPVSYNSKGLRLPKDKCAEYRSKLNLLFPPDVITPDSVFTDSIILDNNALRVKPITVRDSLNISLDENADDQEDEEESPRAGSKPATKPDNKPVTIVYVVKKGDGLLLLADLFDCRVSDIRKWNGMKKDNIYKGQKLKIKVPKNKAVQYRKINSMTMPQKKKLAKRS